ncbi:hypothetical protein Wxf_01565 [Wolbachia endosymbiont of Armadillidium vulgare]|nr:hypothetical protein Wxf_00194 [Wolbachia endosymbiont of Armadillidium vulgare]OJH31833.1 hypothetical protein Wxf_01245 [Wolbachia endosymbiont of Armadillidium vulgare]OJH32142.1 hypothetical protein Wxf_01565 [Wolbachia endosymbiont of Armadillidium vulgare]
MLTISVFYIRYTPAVMKWRFIMSNEIQPKNKLLIVGAGLLFFAMVFPSFFLLAKIAIGLAMIAIATIAVKIASKTISNVLEEKEVGQNQAAQQTTQSKIINLAIGLTSILVGGLSLFIIAQTGLIATCAAITALALYEYIKDEETGKTINDKFDEIANNTTEFCVDSIEKLIPSQSCGV